MSLRIQAEADLASILEDATMGFGYPIALTNPAGASINLVGFSNDIGFAIDPETGMQVSGRAATVALRLASLYAVGFSIPEAVASEDQKPWRVSFADINGLPYEFKVQYSQPDRAIGLVTCTLEAYVP